tara:strand:- start:4699 stop:6798 length:2100 start_codon:yes stop_codon:yes gene_type:complete
MAIPIRLLGGPGHEIQTNLIVQSLDMQVDRGVSAFPTPAYMLKRFAIDTNTPRVTLELNGIVIDDEGVDNSYVSTSSISSSPMKTLINFGNMLPNEPFSEFIPVDLSSARTEPAPTGWCPVDEEPVQHAILTDERGLSAQFPTFVSERGLTQGSTSLIPVTVPMLEAVDLRNRSIDTKMSANLKFAGAHSATATGAFTVASTLTDISGLLAISSNPSVLGAAARLNIGDKVVNAAGTFLGDISALADTTVTFTSSLPTSISANDELFIYPKCFNRKNEFIGHVTSVTDSENTSTTVVASNRSFTAAAYNIQLLTLTQAEIMPGDTLTINQSNNFMESMLDGRSIKLVPSYWLEDSSRNPKGSLCSIDNAMGVTNMAHIGIKFKFDASNTPAVLGGFGSTAQPSLTYAFTPYSRNFAGMNDANNWDAIINIPIKGLLTTDGKSPSKTLAGLFAAAFTLTGNIIPSTMSKTFGTGKTLNDAFAIYTNGPIVIVEQVYRPDSTIEHPKVVSEMFERLLRPQIFQVSSASNVNAAKSAGDKVQDLIGLVSNAEKDIDLFRGIQIPYDSLITSSGVSGVARNFFLTFGDIPISQKGSNQNTRAASQLMNQFILTGGEGGNADNDGADSFFDKVLDAVVPDDLLSIFSFFGDLLEDIFITLDAEPHGNDGGIRIMPEKLHVRYDAGNKYYAFTMVLVATDFVLGI